MVKQNKVSALGSQGTVILELALLAFILLFMGLSALYVDFGISHSQLMSVISRETANVGFRECIVDSAPDTCLNTRITEIYNNTNSRLPGLQIVASIFECSDSVAYDASCAPSPCGPGDTCTCSCNSGMKRLGYAFVGGTGFSATRYGHPNPAVQNYGSGHPRFLEVKSLLDRNKTIVVSEVFYTEQAPFFGGSNFGAFNLYETTIY